MRKFLVLGAVLAASCGKPVQVPVHWEAPAQVIGLVQETRDSLVQAYYMSRVGESYDVSHLIRTARQKLNSLRQDTMALTKKETIAFNRALDMLDSYIKTLGDTSRSFKAIRWTGLAPFDPNLEEATVIIAILALQHNQLDQVARALNRDITDNEKRALKSAYGSVIQNAAGPEVGFWPNPEPGQAGEGLVVEAWPETEKTAGFAGICRVRKDSLLPPGYIPEPVYYVYGSHTKTRGVVQGDSVIMLDSPLDDPNDYYIGLPGPALFWSDNPPESLGPDLCLDAFTEYARATNQSFDSVSVSCSKGFWVWEGHPAHVVFVNAFKRKNLNMFVLIIENGKVVYSRHLDPSQGFMGVELVGAIDLDYDRVSEVVLSTEGEESRSYTVLKKHRGVWWSVVQSETELVGFE